ncbi:NAD(P)-dependent oxidoreductase [Nocardia goodfellowii]
MSRSQPVAFIGLGNMGRPMSGRLLAAGLDLIGFDPAEPARTALLSAGGRTAESAAAAVAESAVVILMLPSSAVVEAVLGDPAVTAALRPGMTIVDMSSSDPLSTRRLAETMTEHGVTLLDAPVSGGVSGAQAGTLAIMCGGPPAALSAIADLLTPLGTATRVGDSGAGHALKAINNLLAGVHLLAAAEAFSAAEHFGLDPELWLPVLNSASGRSAATEQKLPRFIVPKTYDSGFAMSLMLKDMRIATGLAAAVGGSAALGEQAVELWSRAAAQLGPDADQTDIARWVLGSSAE